MRKSLKRILALMLAAVLTVSCLGMTALAGEPAEEVQTITMLRLYNPNTGEHFYTGSEEERDDLVAVGWQYEGKAWEAPVNTGEPVYRMFNPNAGDHHYTMSAEERDNLVVAGWNYEGVAWNSYSSKGVAHYRLYNPNADAGSHHYTASVQELNNLLDNYWKYEGIAFYGYALDHDHEFDEMEDYWNVNNADAGCTVFKCDCGVRSLDHHAVAFVTTKLPTQSVDGLKTGKCACGKQTVTKEIPAGTYNFSSNDPVYFINYEEYNWLYKANRDGTNPELVLDEYVFEILNVADGRVLYRNKYDRYVIYDLSTQKTTIVGSNADLDYVQMDGAYLYYISGKYDAKEDVMNYTAIQQNLETGKKTEIVPQKNGQIFELAAGNGILYFVEQTFLDPKGYLFSYDPKDGTYTQLDAENNVYLYRVLNNCVWYFTGYWDEYGLYQSFNYIIDAKGSKKTSFNPEFHSYNFIYSDENGILYEDNYYTSTRFVSYDENYQKVIRQFDIFDEFLAKSAVGEDWIVLVKNDYVDTEDSWYETYDYYLYDKEYFAQTGSLISFDPVGEIGRMFADGDFPLIDCSTARKPLVAELYELFVLQPGNKGQAPICSTTHGAWLNIADRKVDLAFLAAPTEEEQAYLKEKGVEIDMKLYAGDGLAFIVNSENPVKNLSHQQIIDIYTGKITNWSEVGGPDHKINVKYRDDQSGSQRLFESIVFKGLELPDYEALGFEYDFGMSDIVDSVGWDPYAIGYSIMTYLSDSYYDMEELQILAVDGVAPSPETVMDNSYPYSTKGYIVIRSDEPEDSPARRLYDWFGCKVSDEILISNGISPLKDDS